MPESDDRLDRREFLRRAGLSAAGLALGAPFGRTSSPAKRPNLIYVFADQLRASAVGYAGDRRARTPHIDRLAAQGVSFSNAVSTMPVCAAHRASLFSGLYPSTTGMVVNELRVNPAHRCLGHVLTEAGYETGYIGKWHLWGNIAGNHEADASHYIPPQSRRYRLGFDGYWAAYNFNHQYKKAFYFGDSPRRVLVDGYEPDVQTDLALRFIRDKARKPKPFALVLSYGVPHDPWTDDNVLKEDVRPFEGVDFPLPETWADTPDPYMDRDTDPARWLAVFKPSLPGWRRNYYAMNANLDRNVGRLLRALEEGGIAADTIVVFSSDHGEMFGAHGRVQKLTFYEEAARVPFLVRWPGRVPAGSVRDACLGTPDILPSVLGLMGLPIPAGVEGMDLSRLALGKGGPEPEAAFLQGMGHTYEWIDGFEWRAVRDKRHTYAVYRRDGSEHLYDNVDDPFQKINRAADPALGPTLRGFRDRLAEKRRELQDTFEVCTWYRDHWTDGDRRILRGARG
jgi:arylsulfatase A-like enzyme